MITALTAALLLMTGQAPSGDALIVHPVWTKTPSANQINFAYPAKAKYAGGPVGDSTISCRVTKDGKLETCEIAKEDPAGLGFGEAALQVARYFQMKPLDAAGKPVEGGVVVIPITFSPPR